MFSVKIFNLLDIISILIDLINQTYSYLDYEITSFNFYSISHYADCH